MTKRTRLFLVLALVAGCGSSGKPRSLLPIDITAASDVGTISSVQIFITQGMDAVTDQTLAWTAMAGQPMKVGLYLPDYVDGTVDVHVDAQDGNGTVIGTSSKQPATVHPGETAAVVSVQIQRKIDLGDGGVPPDGAPGPDGATPDTAPGDGGGGDMSSPSDVIPDAGQPDVMTGLTWNPVENLEHDSLSISRQPDVAIDGKGNVLVAWSEGSGVRTKRWDAAAKAWGEIKMIDDRAQVNSIRLGMGANGHATLLWNLYPSDTNMADQGLWASHSKDGGVTWTPRQLVHNGRMYVGGVLAVSREGHARAAWEESPSGSNTDSLWSAYYNDTTGTWGGVAMVKLGNNSYDRTPKIAMDDKGAGLLVWLQGDAAMMIDHDATWGASFEPNQPLKNVQVLDKFDADSTDDPAVAIMPDGSTGLAMWVRRGDYALWTAEFSGGAWKAAERRMSFPNYVSDPAIHFDRGGTLTAVWTQPITTGRTNLAAARRPAGQAWGAPTLLETTNQANGFIDEDPIATVGGDGAGNVFVAWSRKLKADMRRADGTGREYSFAIVTRRFSGGMWEAEKVLAMKEGLRASDPELAVAEDGRAAVAFYYYDPASTGDMDAYNTFADLYK
jgi:hypothetical protein